MIHPILDEFYNQSPSYSRSSHFAQNKGLVSSAPGEAEAQGSMVAARDQLADMDAVRKRLKDVQMGKAA